MSQLTLPSGNNISATLSKWKAQLDPILANPMLSGNSVSDIDLVASTPQAINHLLGRSPQGWFLTDNIADSVVWRTQPFNNKTITLESSATTTISIWVF